MADEWAVQFPLSGDEPVTEKVVAVDLERIQSNPFQPRREFNDEKISELAASIKSCGLLQPVMVRRTEKGYQIVVGERRVLACRRLGWKKISAAVVTLNDDAMATAALIENLQRENLNFLEEAVGYQRLMSQFNLTQEHLAQRLGKSQSTIANKIRLLKLPDKVKETLLEGNLTERHARALLKLKNEQQQMAMINEMAKNNMTVSRAEQRINELAGTDTKKAAVRKAKPIIRDMRIVLNTIREAIKIINRAGLYPRVQEKVEQDSIEVTIKLTKDMLAGAKTKPTRSDQA